MSSGTATTPLSLFLQVEGRRLHVECLGQGPPLVLLHSGGGGYEPGLWDEGCRALATRYRLWRYSRAGYGLSEPRAAFEWGFFEEEAAVLVALCDRLALGPDTALLGTSDGGTIALVFAARWPGRLSALVVEGAHGYFEPSMARELERRFLRFREKHPEPLGVPRLVGARLWFEGFRDPRWRGWSILDRLGPVVCPVLVIQGERDPFVGPDHAFNLGAALPGADVVILPEGRHLCHRSHPGVFYPLVLRFLSGVGV